MKQQSGDNTQNLKHSFFPVSSSLNNETITSPFKLSLLQDLIDAESSLSLGLIFNLHFIHLYPFSPSSTEIGDNLKVSE
jgi:hypothetical protein